MHGKGGKVGRYTSGHSTDRHKHADRNIAPALGEGEMNIRVLVSTL